MSIGMLVWVYAADHLKTTLILSQISLILVIQIFCDILWLLADYVENCVKLESVVERQHPFVYRAASNGRVGAERNQLRLYDSLFAV